MAWDTRQGYLTNQNILINAIILACNPHRLLVSSLFAKYALWLVATTNVHYSSSLEEPDTGTPRVNPCSAFVPCPWTQTSSTYDLLTQASPCHFCFFCLVLAPCWHPLVKENSPELGNKAKRAITSPPPHTGQCSTSPRPPGIPQSPWEMHPHLRLQVLTVD